MSTPRNRPVSLPHAEPVMNADGVPFSTEFGDIYHSLEGSDGEQARHVFLGGNALPERWRGRAHFTIVETGFGLGLNFLETWRAFDDDPRAPHALHYVSVENRPVSGTALRSLHARWPQHAERSRELLAAWPLPLAGFHRIHLAAGRITVTLLFGEAEELLPQLEARADAFYLDGFAPDRNPQLWSQAVFRELARIAAPGATLATWTVAASVRDGLATAGFTTEKHHGLGKKRDILAGHYTASASTGHAYPARHTPAASNRSAIIIGAGIAGSACAERLAARGWQVTLLERHAAAAAEGSGNPLALASPLVNFADEANARLSRAAFLYARNWYAMLSQSQAHAATWFSATECGILRIARDARDAARFAQLLERLAYPPALAAYADVGEGARLAGRAVSRAGMWFPTGMTLDPAAACASALSRWPAQVTLRFAVAASRLECSSGNWRVLDEAGACIGEAPVVILAGGTGVLSFDQAKHLPLEAIRGQVTLLPAARERRLDVAVSGDRHAANLPDGRCMVGATFQPGDADRSLRASDHADNMASVEDMLPGFCDGMPGDSPQLGGRTAFRAVTPDRLPLFGALGGALDESSRSEQAAPAADAPPPQLFVAGGLGARGVVWAPLGAEMIAAQINGEPWPLARELALAMHPQRYSDK